MQNQRLFKRRHLIYYLRIFKARAKNPLGFLVDIHTQGFMITSEKKVETEKNFKLKMDLPENISGKKQVTFEAKGVWCRPGINTDFYETGFELTKISDEDAFIIENLVNLFGFND